jgi:hypothetical protein
MISSNLVGLNRRSFFKSVAATGVIAAMGSSPTIPCSRPGSRGEALSERSVPQKSRPVDIPDFTRGKWKVNPPLGITEE